ncbi:MAG: hypothetical protein IJ955_03800, partial [Oscillospiraceae bacterium]|nr:hypothetical protein [Oscillospiraceae bacterium]
IEISKLKKGGQIPLKIRKKNAKMIDVLTKNQPDMITEKNLSKTPKTLMNKGILARGWGGLQA